MQGAIARVCMVVAAAILNHPLLFPQENSTLPEQDEELISRMREHEEMLVKEQARLEEELSQLESKQEESSKEGYSWYFWSAVSFVIFFTIEMCRVDIADTDVRPVEDEDMFSESGSVTPRMMVLDKDLLSNFCDKCTYTSAHENWRVREFVEGFADDLLESLRSVCDREADMEVWDFVGIGSMFESWKVCKPLMCDLLVPFSPPDPHSFQFQLWCSSSSDVPPDMQGCGKIKVTKENEEGCLCGSANLGEDMLCLLHSRNDVTKVDRSPEELLCSRNTPFLAKDQVMKWFQISVTKAWGRISHKYDFEVTFRNLDAAGALKIRFRSGKVIVMNIIPVVQLEDTDAYFVSHFPSDCESPADPYWPLSFAVYERNLLKYYAKRLPQHSCHLHCLQIVTFLHRKQTGLTGKSALTNYHFKTALLHLLLSKNSSSWGYENMEHRLRDVLCFMQKSLQEKRLHHALIGNSKVPKHAQVPEMIRTAEPVNLLRSLVLQTDLYAATVRHFQEMLRNANVLIQEYTPQLSNGFLHHSRDESL
ncbi:inositol 1,4,5-trisphosphate receptor-interacting protein [Notolabrus celidotus]|uniref:inositol 1,4,5-trisphosphate receptor-interacting protein n=1 Tax=Notolabrus celidotus TaxID=1203425 RepID=UPI00148FB9BE|nr:inositol 1,4,5-trisphosphate receptor-interacting protein [Notolabrus celidotus]XP_034537903.1 inositol 1,4,5-trisphosphate receptor-interacting protein [Notolabrus celidotus]XP_034537904.1 inositol 1,4,5-trisphosphate receptor-interacting protein [Notolabrus celidotus]